MICPFSGRETKTAREHRGRHDCISFLSWRPKGNVFIGKVLIFLCKLSTHGWATAVAAAPHYLKRTLLHVTDGLQTATADLQQQTHYEDVQLIFTDFKGPVWEMTEPGASPWFRLLEKHSGAFVQVHQICMEMLEHILANATEVLITSLFQLPHNCIMYCQFFCQQFQIKCHSLGLLGCTFSVKLTVFNIVERQTIHNVECLDTKRTARTFACTAPDICTVAIVSLLPAPRCFCKSLKTYITNNILHFFHFLRAEGTRERQ